MIKAANGVPFLWICLWSLVVGLVLGLGFTIVIGLALGWFQQPQTGDDMAQGIGFLFTSLLIGNATSYIMAILMGRKYALQQGQRMKSYLVRSISLSVAALLLSFMLLPALLFASVTAACIVVFSVHRPSESPPLDHPMV